MKNFTIVNPIIKGSLDTTIRSDAPLNAAIDAYKNMSAYFAKNVPHFAFTLQEGGNMHHYIATEKVNDSGKIKFTIKENKGVKNVSSLTNFIKTVYQKDGGGHSKSKSKYRYEDDSSSESSDYNYYRPVKRQSAIDYWYYYPNVYNYDYYYVPQFTSAVVPYVYISTNR